MSLHDDLFDRRFECLALELGRRPNPLRSPWMWAYLLTCVLWWSVPAWTDWTVLQWIGVTVLTNLVGSACLAVWAWRRKR